MRGNHYRLRNFFKALY